MSDSRSTQRWLLLIAVILAVGGSDYSSSADEIIREYEESIRAETLDRLGPRLETMTPNVGTVFPNMSYLPRQPRSIAVWHPRGPAQTEAWRWYLVDKSAPQEVKDFLRHYYIRYSGPGGLTEQDDMENWNYAHNASRGVIARRFPYNYQMGMGFDGPPVDIDAEDDGTDTAVPHTGDTGAADTAGLDTGPTG